jgi:hypothetical protein
MTEFGNQIRTLAPHDPLPGGHSVVLVRRFHEDRPADTIIEMIVTNPDRSEETEIPLGPGGAPLDWPAAVAHAQDRARQEGLKRIWTVDRTAGRREQDVLRAGGDHTVDMDQLDDSDPEDGEAGSDMRDMDRNTAPRRF